MITKIIACPYENDENISELLVSNSSVGIWSQDMVSKQASSMNTVVTDSEVLYVITDIKAM